MKRLYDVLGINATLSDVIRWIESATRERRIDLSDFNDQVSTNTVIFGTIPTSSTDIIGTEKPGDIAVDANFLYVAVLDGTDVRWRRVAISSF